MQAVIYARQSLDRNEGRSVEDQEVECRAECERKGWPVRKVYRDQGISASRYGRQRPEWEKLKRGLRNDDVIVMWEASRGQRELGEFVELRDMCAELGVLVSYGGRVLDFTKGDDRFSGGIDALIAERESENLRERVMRGKRSAAVDGRPAGRVKWGYKVTSPGVWEPDPVEAPKVKEAVARLLRGDSAYSVVQWLDTKEGYHPSVTALRRSLASPTYAGLRVFQGEVIGKGTWPALITEAEHRQLLAMQRQRTAPPASPEPRHLLSGIAKCATCGFGVGWKHNRHGTPIYTCRRGHVSRLADPLDAMVTARLFAAFAKIDPRQHDDDDAEVAAIWAEVDALKAKLVKWRDMALNDEVSPESFAVFEKQLTKQIADLQTQAVPDDYLAVDPATVEANWDDTPMRDKRAIVSAFFTVTIHPATQGHKVGTNGVDVTPKFGAV